MSRQQLDDLIAELALHPGTWRQQARHQRRGTGRCCAAGAGPRPGRPAPYELVPRGVNQDGDRGAQARPGPGRRADRPAPYPGGAGIVDETRSLEYHAPLRIIADGWLPPWSRPASTRWTVPRPMILTSPGHSLVPCAQSHTGTRSRSPAPAASAVAFSARWSRPALRLLLVIYPATWDSAGGQIEANTRRVLESYTRRGNCLLLQRPKMCEHNLPVIVKSATAATTACPQAVETEALSQPVRHRDAHGPAAAPQTAGRRLMLSGSSGTGRRPPGRPVMGAAFDRLLARLEIHAKPVVGTGTKRMASCPGPGHWRGDVHPSQSVSDGGGKVLLHCHGGCSSEDVLTVLGLTAPRRPVRRTAAGAGH